MGAPVAAGMLDPHLYVPGKTLKRGLTGFVYGWPGTWKTTVLGQFPRALFLSIGAEGGDDALAFLPELYGRPAPIAYDITSTQMLLDRVRYIESDHKRITHPDTGEVGIATVVVDSMTFYADLWVAELMGLKDNMAKATGGKHAESITLTRRDWGNLGMHIRDIAMRLHNTGLNVWWTSLAREKYSDESKGDAVLESYDPYVKGEAASKLPGMCKMILFADKVSVSSPTQENPGRRVSVPVWHSAPTRLAKLPRHKYGPAFPNGVVADPEYGNLPTFKAFHNAIPQFIYWGPQ